MSGLKRYKDGVIVIFEKSLSDLKRNNKNTQLGRHVDQSLVLVRSSKKMSAAIL